jgi:hypothetical protein
MLFLNHWITLPKGKKQKGVLMQYVCSKKSFSLVLVAGLSLSACELVSSSKTAIGIGDYPGSQGALSSASALTSISAALQSDIVSYDSSCQSHSDAVQQAYETQIEGQDLSAAQVMAILQGVPDPSGLCLNQLLAVADQISSHVAVVAPPSPASALATSFFDMFMPSAQASVPAKLRQARILRVAYVIHVAKNLKLGSLAAKSGFELSAAAIQRDLDVASIPALNTGYGSGN